MSKKMNRELSTQKRSFDRIPSRLEFHCFNIRHFGTVTNISENGMFLRSKNITFPFETEFEISIPTREEVLKLSVEVKRLTKSEHYYDGIAVELINPSTKYLRFMKGLRRTFHNQDIFLDYIKTS